MDCIWPSLILNKVKNVEQNDAKTIVFFTEPHAKEYFAKIRIKI